MIMAGLYCTGKLPFRDIMLHGTVRDETGKKMSKSLGNSIDPLEVIDSHGADALRFSLMMITAQGADVYLQNDTFDIGRNFANKLWNASRFLLGNIENSIDFKTLPQADTYKTEDRWILSRLTRTISSVRSSMEAFKFNEACHKLYDFIWHDFCDWYVEAKKADLYQEEAPARKENALNLCSYCLAGILKLLHPFMPYITEEIWGHLSKKVSYSGTIEGGFILNAQFPVSDDNFTDENIETHFSLLQDIIISLRTIRAENNVPPEKHGNAVIIPTEESLAAWLRNEISLINMFARLDATVIDCKAQKPGFAGQGVVKGTQVFLELEGLIDKEVEISRLSKEIEHLEQIAGKAKKKIENENFLKRAPEAVVEKEQEKYKGILLNLEKLQKSLEELKK
jgi:valyl-tRNA synthetase